MTSNFDGSGGDLHDKNAPYVAPLEEGSHLYQPELWFSSTTKALINRTKSNVEAYKSAVKEYSEKEQWRQKLLQDHPQYQLRPAIQGRVVDPTQTHHPNDTSFDPSSRNTENSDVHEQDLYSSKQCGTSATSYDATGDPSSQQGEPVMASTRSLQTQDIHATDIVKYRKEPLTESRQTEDNNFSDQERLPRHYSTDSSLAATSTSLSYSYGQSRNNTIRNVQSHGSSGDGIRGILKKRGADREVFSQAREAIDRALEEEKSIAAEIEQKENQYRSIPSNIRKPPSRSSQGSTSYINSAAIPSASPSPAATDVKAEQQQSYQDVPSRNDAQKSSSPSGSDVNSILTSVNELKKDLLSLHIPTDLDALKRLRDQEAEQLKGQSRGSNSLASSVHLRLHNVNRRLSRALSARQQFNSARLARPRSVTAPKRTFRADSRKGFGRCYSAPPPSRNRERMQSFLDTIWTGEVDASKTSERCPDREDYSLGVTVPNPRSIVYDKDVPTRKILQLADAYRRGPVSRHRPQEKHRATHRKFQSTEDRLGTAFGTSFYPQFDFLQTSEEQKDSYLRDYGPFCTLHSKADSEAKSKTVKGAGKKKRKCPTTKRKRNVPNIKGLRNLPSYKCEDIDGVVRSSRASTTRRSCSNSLTRNTLMRKVDMVLNSLF